MDEKLIMEYHYFLRSIEPYMKTPEEVVKSYFENGDDRFFVKQELIDANPRFLELVNCSDHIKRIEIDQVLGDDLVKYMPFERLHNIEQIKFFGSNINGFFKHSKHMPNLKELYIGLNYDGIPNGQRLDDEIDQLKSLKDLDIRGTKVDYLPDTLGKIATLERLSLMVNAKIPDTIVNLPKLTDLGIHVYDINHIPYTLDLLGKINGLKSLGYGDSSGIPPVFHDNLTSLESLGLGLWSCKEAPISVRKMVNLESLTMVVNFDAIPYWLTELVNLEYLAFDYLPGNTLPTFLKKLPKLKHINLTNCVFMFNEQEINQIKEDFLDYKVYEVNVDFRGQPFL